MIKTTTIYAPEYPFLLRHIHNPPQTLYYRGTLPQGLFNIAFVGSRKMTDYGRQATEILINGLQGLPVCIVSGLAYGIDAHAHKTALQNNLKTIAVLGSGVDDNSLYPRAHRALAYKIMEAGGALVSTYPPGTEAIQWHFPDRNQIISGLSTAVVIVEAAEKSGALITAQFALDQNRDVFSVAGSIFQGSSAGTNNLIKNSSAKLISCAEDIIVEYDKLRELASKQMPEQIDPSLTAIQRQILAKIQIEPTAFAEIVAAVQLPIPQLNSELTLLEIKNKIRNLGNNFYTKNLTTLKQRG